MSEFLRFLRFPHTPHIAWLTSGAPRDDKVQRNAWAAELGMSVVPCIFKGRISMTRLQSEAADSVSRFRMGGMEGVIVRKEGKMWLEARAKLVRGDFIQTIAQHWRGRLLEPNHLALEKWQQLSV